MIIRDTLHIDFLLLTMKDEVNRQESCRNREVESSMLLNRGGTSWCNGQHVPLSQLYFFGFRNVTSACPNFHWHGSEILPRHIHVVD